MTQTDIENFFAKKNSGNLPVMINFKTRRSLKGLFIKLRDFDELRGKNLWRIVTENHLPTYLQSNDGNLAKIFNGVEMTKLEMI